jgi:hypothetical protein
LAREAQSLIKKLLWAIAYSQLVQVFLKLDFLKLESKQGFSSIRANNCVFKGKWVYEVELVSNKLCQIGWCQLYTTFNTHNGVGDDKTSYAYDGYRITLWHDGPKKYGELWDTGDVIGVAIDLDNKRIEFFKNGKSLGIALENIPADENIAYFPGISLSNDEKVIFNFGKSPLAYAYSGYEAFDTPDYLYNGTIETTKECIQIFRTYIFKILLDDSISQFHKLSLANNILSYLALVSFKDSYVLKTILVPFLYDLSGSLEHFVIFFQYLYLFLDENEKLDFTASLFEKLSNYLEETSLRGAACISEWKTIIVIITTIIENLDFIVQYWIDGNKYIENLKAIFNSNLVKNVDIYNYLKNKYNDFNTDLTAYQVMKEIKQNYQVQIEQENGKYELVYSDYLKKLIKILLTDNRNFKKEYTKDIKLNAIIADYINKGFQFGHPNDFQNLFALNFAKHDYSYFYKNFLFNLYDVIAENYDKELEFFSTDLWFTRMSNDNIYYDEVGIGGTISHVTSEFINTIDESFRHKTSEPLSELFHRVIKLSFAVITPALKDYCNILDKCKSLPFQSLSNFEHGGDTFILVFRHYFYLFTQRNQGILYSYAYYLIKWINTMIRKNKNIVYFIPKMVLDVPYEIFKLLNKIKSPAIFNTEYRKQLNLQSPHFKEDNFLFEIVYFYTLLFSDMNIANPEIRESLIYKIKYFMGKKKTAVLYETNSKLIEFLIKGLLKYMTLESLSHIACDIMVKIVKPICFGPANALYEKKDLVNVAQKFFSTNVTTFHDFMDNYTKLINKVMTDYTIVLNEANNVILVFNFRG